MAYSYQFGTGMQMQSLLKDTNSLGCLCGGEGENELVVAYISGLK